jgi:hypothetical protein
MLAHCVLGEYPATIGVGDGTVPTVRAIGKHLRSPAAQLDRNLGV